MSHANNTKAFAKRMGRGFWSRAKRFSESAKPAPAGLASAGTTGADSGRSYVTTEGTDATLAASPFASQPGVEQQQQRGANVISRPERPSPPSTHSAGGGVCCVMLAAQVHADRWATLATIAVFICGFAIMAIRANRSSRPQPPTRGHSGGSAPRNNRS